MDDLVQLFSIFGGQSTHSQLNPFDSLSQRVEHEFSSNFLSHQIQIYPEYLLDSPYRELLISISRSDGKLNNVLRRSRLDEKLGGSLVAELIEKNILFLEESREQPIRKSPHTQIKKSLRGYRIQPKVRFQSPFYRFWFGFVEPYREHLLNLDTTLFMENFLKHKDKAFYVLFEQLSNLWLEKKYLDIDPIVSLGGFWNHKSEFDILQITKSGKLILGECKFKAKKITTAELTKLKHKASESNIPVDRYILFSRSGFSIDLLSKQDENLILCSVDDFSALL